MFDEITYCLCFQKYADSVASVPRYTHLFCCFVRVAIIPALMTAGTWKQANGR